MTKHRCAWVPPNDALYIAYHDEEWGIPVHNDHKLFEMLILEGAQAGLSWKTILQKRKGYKEAFDHFDPQKIVAYDSDKIAELLTNPEIVRNRLKISAAVTNARAMLSIQAAPPGFSHYLWQFVNGQPVQNAWQRLEDVPTLTPESDAMSQDLKKRGFKFVGSKICYAFMQAVGMVNDHTTDCFRYSSIRRLSENRNRSE
ncbi:MAG: DNA-3-methyladenine glycosylase I [Methylococcales bacterium]